jgi:asparagine synthase (glutamine-hydrolysing)
VYDEPFMDPSHVPTYLISQYARRYVKVVLTGDGADELFGGYAWYPLLAASTEVSSTFLPWLVSRGVSRLLADRMPRLARYSQARSLARRWPDPWIRYMNYRSTHDGMQRAALWGERDATAPIFASAYYRPGDETSGLDRALYFDLLSFLPGDILVKVDRAAMAHGLETRAPFLDRDVVEFALSLPASLKATSERTKILFKSALSRFWPKGLHARGKQGFAAPYHVWLARADVQALARRVFAPGSALRALLPGVASEMHRERSYRAWNLLTLGLWLERHSANARYHDGNQVFRVDVRPRALA